MTAPDGAPGGAGLRIAMVCPYSLGRPGGVQGQATGLAHALRRRGHQVVVLAPYDARGDAVDAEPSDTTGSLDGHRSVGIGRALGIRSNGSVAPVAPSPLAAARVVGFVRHHAVDVVHLHEPLAPVAGFGVLLRHPVPVVATFHRSGSSAWYRALRPAARFARRRIDVACAVSAAAARTASDALGGDYEVLFNGVDTEHFAAARPRPTEGRPTVLFVGRHEERKGLGVLLEAFGRLGRAELWVAGNGPLTAELRRRHPPSDRVRWLGVLTEAEKASAMAGADVLCAPSLGGESFGVVLLEGLAAGCVVVASDIEGYRQAAGESAVLVAPGDPVALADALRRALALSPEERARRVATGATQSAAWSMDRLAEVYEERYRRVVAPGGT